MSHVATVEVHITDLGALAAAAKRLGLEFAEGQKSYRWYGRHVGDYSLPAGFSESDLGKCEHAIRVPGNSEAYEVGVVRRRDGKPGYTLQWDFWSGGYGLQEFVGEDCKRLVQAYATERASRQARQMGYRVTEKQRADGTIELALHR